MDMVPRFELRTGDIGYIISRHQNFQRGEGGIPLHILPVRVVIIAGFEEVK